MTGVAAGRLATVVTVAALITGCASSGQEGTASERQAEEVMLTVENQNWQDATVYLVGSGPRIRLGTVSTNGTNRFVVPPTMRSQGTVRLAVDLIGSSATTVTDPIMVNPGAEIRWTIQNHLALSSYRVR